MAFDGASLFAPARHVERERARDTLFNLISGQTPFGYPPVSVLLLALDTATCGPRRTSPPARIFRSRIIDPGADEPSFAEVLDRVSIGEHGSMDR